MRNYWVSISLHLAVILLLLFPFLDTTRHELSEDQVIYVDFSSRTERSPVVKPTEPTREKPKRKKTVNEAKKTAAKPKSSAGKSASAKKEEEPPKPSAPPAQITQDESVIKKLKEDKAKKEAEDRQKLEAEAVRKQRALDLAKARALEARKKAQQIESFTSLIEEAATPTEQVDKADSNIGNSPKPHSGASSKSDITGHLGNRKVIRKPVIKDKSQKYGRVVVKICVAAEGNVISAEYTQIGSTTTDDYLIRLAEEGAMQYLFSPSPNAKECGKVVIDFQLK